MQEGFLDSSIVWAYVGPKEFERKHDVCVEIFDSPHAARFTSETVRTEVRNSERNRARLYADLIAHLRAGRRPEEFPVDRFSRHVAARARELVRRVRMKLADIEYFRRLGQMESARLRAAWSEIGSPLVPAAHDAYREDLLRGRLGLELGDAKVLTDYLSWAPSREAAKFVTADDRSLAAIRAGIAGFLGDEGTSKPTVDDFLEPETFKARLAA